MVVAVTGATGFLGHYIVGELLKSGYRCRCWKRRDAHLSRAFRDHEGLHWVEGDLSRPDKMTELVKGADAVVHGALYRLPGQSFQEGVKGHFIDYLETNLMGTLRLMSAARDEGVRRFIFISSCAVHDEILPGRTLDESHPLRARSHYGAYKGAVEKFVHSFGLGEGWDICALRPTGVYGMHHEPPKSKWFDLIKRVGKGETVASDKGGKEVHASDVAKAVTLLLKAEGIRGQSYNCYDSYVSEEEVVRIAAPLWGSKGVVGNLNRGPKNQIETGKIRTLGMTFGGKKLLEKTVEEIVRYQKKNI